MHPKTGLARRRRAGALLAAAGALLLPAAVRAADHREAPLTRSDPAADIADVYAWHDPAAGTLTAIVTFDGIRAPERRHEGTFDPRVRYTVHIDNDGDNRPDIAIHTRFARDRDGRWGLMVENLPGAAGPVIGPVERRIDAGPRARVWAGLREDPFFFDLEGFRTTLATGALSFDGGRDTFAGMNTTAIVLEMDLDAALGRGRTLSLWATTARAGGRVP